MTPAAQLAAALKKKRVRKYRNTPVMVDDVRFDSKKEAARWGELKLLERVHKISRLSRQVPIPLEVNGFPVCKLVADFVYEKDGRQVIEDVKSPITRKNPVYRLKSRLLYAVTGQTVQEV